jgi:hypothetical protein
MPNIDTPSQNHNPKLADRIEVFRARCWARALLCEEGWLDTKDSIKLLQIAALDMGLYDLDADLPDRIITEEFSA